MKPTFYPFLLSFLCLFSFTYLASGQRIIPIEEEPPMIRSFEFLGPDSAGLTLAPGEAVLVRWSSSGINPGHKVQVKFSANDGQNFNYLLAAGVPIGNNQVVVNMPDIATLFGRFRLLATGTGDSSRTDLSANPVVLSSTLFCQPSAMVPTNGFISNVRITNSGGVTLLNNPSTNQTSGFRDYSATVAVPGLQRAGTTTPQFTIQVATGGSQSASIKNVAIWIDYNNDNQFASGSPEFLGTFTATTGTVFRRTFSIPSTVTAGIKRLRVRLVQGTSFAIPGSGACLVSFSGLTSSATTNLGETEDYAINVLAPSGSARVAVADEGAGSQQSMLYPSIVRKGEQATLQVEHAEANARVVIINANGQVLEQTNLPVDRSMKIPSMSLPAGLYIVQVFGAGQKISHKLRVE